LDSNWNPSLAQNNSNLGWGIVTNPNPSKYSEFTVNVRKDAPKISLFGFKLGKKICTVRSETEFHYSEIIQTLNDQIWYKVKIDNPLEFAKPSCPKPLQGWLIAQQSDGTRLVDEIPSATLVQTAEFNQIAAQESLEDGEIERFETPAVIPPQTKLRNDSLPESDAPYLDVRPEKQQTETPSDSNRSTDSETVGIPNESVDKWGTFSNYLLVCLGSVLGLLVITFEQSCSNDEINASEILNAFTKRIISSIFLIRLLVLIVVSCSFISILGRIEQKDNLLTAIQTLSSQGLYEPVIAGFLICIVILSFTSASK